MIQTEQMSAAEMKRVIVATALLSALCSLALSISAFGEVLSRDAIFSARRHVDIRGDPLRRGRRCIRIPRAWRRFRVFVFWTFEHAGLVFLYACSLNAALLLPACACRMLKSQQHTRYPKRRAQGQAHDPRSYRAAPAKRYHFALIAGGASLMLCYSFLRGELSARLLYIASFAPLTWHLFSVLRVRECRDFDGRLKVVALSTFAMSALFFVGEILG